MTLRVSSPKSMNFSDSPNYGNFILDRLKSEKDTGRFCDVILHVQGRQFCAHRNVLAACSPYFDSILKMHKIVKEQLTITCQNGDVFQHFLNYMYTGTVLIEDGNVMELLRMANHFLVIKLKAFCAEYLEKNLSATNCLKVRELAVKYALPQLAKVCIGFAVKNLTDVVNTKEILECNSTVIETLLKSEGHSAAFADLLHLTSKWILRDVGNREKEFGYLLRALRCDNANRSDAETYLKKDALLAENDRCLYLALNYFYDLGFEFNMDSGYDDVFKELKLKFSERRTAEGFETPDCDYASTDDFSTALGKDSTGEPIFLSPSQSVSASTGSSCQELKLASRRFVCEDEIAPLTVVPNRRGRVTGQIKRIRLTKIDGRNVVLTTLSSSKSRFVKHTSPYRTSLPKIPSRSPLSNTLLDRRKRRMVLRSLQQSRILQSRVRRRRSLFLKKRVLNTSRAFGCSGARRCGVRVDEGAEVMSDEGSSDDASSVSRRDRVRCNRCPFTASSGHQLERHMSRVHAKEVTYKCRLCSFTCKWNKEYFAHMSLHFQGPPFSCSFCEFNSDQIENFMSHRAKHAHQEVVRSPLLKCSQCDFRCELKCELATHCQTAHPEYVCQTCSKVFNAKHLLEQHILTSHKVQEIAKIYSCDECDFTTKFQAQLVVHRRIHAPVPSLVVPSVYTTHLPVPGLSPKQLFKCEFTNCTYSTAKKSQLQTHARTHTAVRSHVCTQCGRAFIEKSHLVRHEKIHLGEKPFKCERCDYASSRSDKLKEHNQKHHGDNPTAKIPYKPRKSGKMAVSAIGQPTILYVTDSPVQSGNHAVSVGNVQVDSGGTVTVTALATNNTHSNLLEMADLALVKHYNNLAASAVNTQITDAGSASTGISLYETIDASSLHTKLIDQRGVLTHLTGMMPIVTASSDASRAPEPPPTMVFDPRYHSTGMTLTRNTLHIPANMAASSLLANSTLAQTHTTSNAQVAVSGGTTLATVSVPAGLTQDFGNLSAFMAIIDI